MSNNFLLISSISIISILFACRQKPAADAAANPGAATAVPFDTVLERYHRERLPLYPLEATVQGMADYNDRLPIDVSTGYRQQLRDFYTRYRDQLTQYDTAALDANDRISYAILKWETDINLQNLEFPDHYLPINQFWSLPLTLGQYGSGEGAQPFRTVADYDAWLRRAGTFAVWADSAIGSMRTGMAGGYVLPRVLVERVIPQLNDLIVTDPTKSLFYGPIQRLPADLPAAERARLTEAYRQLILQQLVPAFTRLRDFFKNDYLPKARATAGISDLPGGRERYNFLIRQWTTTNLTADEIFALGEQEVARIRGEMEKVRQQVGFQGDLRAFFDYVRTDPKFMPFKKPEDVIAWYAALEGRMQPQLNRMFDLVPRSKFEVRRTEAFREASASAEYSQGTPDGSRPGIFYVPVPNARKANVVGGEALFLHEAIPGHHYQVSLQQENTALPTLRRFLWYGAYGEGWALYAESLGPELGLYTDPYQYFGMLSSEMHRAIRLVVDVGLHTRGWTREQAIEYSKANEAEPEESIISEIERYMAIPGQALSYKIGQLKILELRRRAEQQLGPKFDIRQFHNQVLEAGVLPLAVLEAKINRWIAEKKGQD